jgi:hypothetical protein
LFAFALKVDRFWAMLGVLAVGLALLAAILVSPKQYLYVIAPQHTAIARQVLTLAM